jgi:hypothetical protein
MALVLAIKATAEHARQSRPFLKWRGPQIALHPEPGGHDIGIGQQLGLLRLQ